MMNGDNYKSVTPAALRGWGWTPGANESVDIWVEGSGRSWRATLTDVRGSSEYSYATTGVFNGLAGNSRGASIPQPAGMVQPAGVRVNSITEGMDETALAATLTAASVTLLEVCASTAVVPGPRSTSSLPDHTTACLAAANTSGASMLSIIRALYSTASGRAALATLTRHFITVNAGITTVTTPDWVNTSNPELQTPTPPPAYGGLLGAEWRTSGLISALKLRNAGLTEEQATVAANECLKLVAAAALGTDPYSECKDKPIFFSGRDVPEATDHDIEALATNPAWVALNYENRTRTNWYRSDPRCISLETGTDCDEYPFNATAQGGEYAAPPVSLKQIDSAQNQNQGSYYSAFLTACKVRERPAMDFLAVPVPESLVEVPTFRVCNP